MKKFYDKSELGFALVWIGIYCVGMSTFDEISRSIGVGEFCFCGVCLGCQPVPVFLAEKAQQAGVVWPVQADCFRKGVSVLHTSDCPHQ